MNSEFSITFEPGKDNVIQQVVRCPLMGFVYGAEEQIGIVLLLEDGTCKIELSPDYTFTQGFCNPEALKQLEKDIAEHVKKLGPGNKPTEFLIQGVIPNG